MDFLIQNPIVQNAVFFILGAIVSLVTTLWSTNRANKVLRQEIADLRSHIDRQIPYTTHLREALKNLHGKVIEGEGRIAIDQDANDNPIRMQILSTQEIRSGFIPSEE